MKRLFILASPLVLVFLAIAAWIGCEIYHARSSSADGITVYADYRDSLPDPVAARQFIKDGFDYYVFFGPVSAPIALPSGPPAYVFDIKGNMVDWTTDTGEDPRFSFAWTAHQGSEIDIDNFDLLLPKNKTIEQDVR